MAHSPILRPLSNWSQHALLPHGSIQPAYKMGLKATGYVIHPKRKFLDGRNVIGQIVLTEPGGT